MTKLNKQNKLRKNAPQKKRKTGSTPSAAELVAGLDAPAKAWARLLADPCNAPLASPCYPTSSGGSIIRVERDVVMSTTATSYGGAVIFTPGLFDNTGSGALCSVATLDTSLDNQVLPFSNQYGFQPGNGNVNWDSVRPVAACLQLMWPGSELNRQGIVSLAVVPTAFAFQSSTGTSVQSLRQASPIVSRMPDSVVEVKWRPGEKDNQFNATQIADLTVDSDGRNSLLATWTGIPGSTGVRVRMVAIYEVSFVASSGYITSVTTNSAPASKHSVNDIFHALDRAGEWAYSLATGPAAKLAWDVGGALFKKAPAMLALM